ncbi:site-specific integrase [Chitinophaga sancti]|uniref:Site-specific integrase n=1 Tax=Chitinophaga sancti TaxID=1004 RepID=A0A1K1PR71_9BACT|nr:site-specific integrase [Chitinophaga sancti]WQD61744.1 site-specific integrase [Chitinophaga sancti]WQG92698.1 site-specific integrase [Chitinophaga sancti]SFW50033.1 Site-specific recombinase XerD [Chitinophaga sancti]
MNVLNTKYNFWLAKSKINSFGKVPIYMRITVGTERTEISTGIYINIKNWDDKRQSIKGKDIDVDINNAKLDTLVKSFKLSVKELIDNEVDYTSESLKNKILGKDVVYKSLIPIFESHLKKMEELEGKDYASSTVKRYKTTLTHVQEFIKYKFKQNDVLLSHLNLSFVNELEHYFKTVKNCNHNSSVKYIKNLRSVINQAVANGFIEKDPFANYKAKIKPVEMEFLNEAEIAKIEEKQFDIARMENIKKIFLFQIYTGLAYVDIENLRKSNIVEVQGKKWINTSRTKTNIPVRLPLIKKALELIDLTISGDKIFNVPSNQKFNSYLKELGTICGINKNLCTHMARRTFATTITLLNGVSIDAVSKMLGHTKISTTQIYAKVVDEKLLKEMEKIDE